jgi:hypothetical protein
MKGRANARCTTVFPVFTGEEFFRIGKGKAAAPYEFGVKTSIVTNNGQAPGGLSR